MEEVFNVVSFLNRLHALQWLCSEKDRASPKALLFIPGPDGRSNCGSIQLLKYLFKGAVGKDLLDDTLSEDLESLDDMESYWGGGYSLSSSTMKKALMPMLSAIPFLIEYTYTVEEENDVDRFQLRKCINFKRMILEALEDGDDVGIPIPIAYDDVMEVENWPMLQAFALDNVLCSTGFFTNRYTVADIGPYLNNLFRTVDSFYIDNAIKLTNAMIVPHLEQLLGVLDCPTVSQRQRLSADDVLGPLHVLFDFGELEAEGLVESFMKPMILFGASTENLINGRKNVDLDTALVSNSIHLVVESSEPSSGLRWCRTYFLASALGSQLLEELQRLQKEMDVDLQVDEDEEEDQADVSVGKMSSCDIMLLNAEQQSLLRLQRLYVKLWLTMRYLAKKAFTGSSDILAAAGELQTKLTEAMTTEAPFQVDEDFVTLSRLFEKNSLLGAQEYLQIHMDCMNALGEVITADDVEDLGGVCWIYIRVSIHGIRLPGGTKGAVAVGDTFLFSPLAQKESRFPPNDDFSATLRHPDSTCITHCVPYYRCFIGGGIEELFSRAMLGLGKSLGAYDGGQTVNLTILTDQVAAPSYETHLQLYSEGFVVDKMDRTNCVPRVVSFTRDIDRVWTVDIKDCLQQASNLLPISARSQLMQALPSNLREGGYVFILGFKRAASVLQSVSRDISVLLSAASAQGERYIALVIPRGEAAELIFQDILERWRVAFRMSDIVEYRGNDVSVPKSILLSLLSWGDNLALNQPIEPPSNPFSFLVQFAQQTQSGASGLAIGSLSLRCRHALAEVQRLSSFDFNSLHDSPLKSHLGLSKKKSGSRTILITGLPGCGIDSVSNIVIPQLIGSESFQQYRSVIVEVDLLGALSNSIDKPLATETIHSQVSSYIEKSLQSLRKSDNDDITLTIIVLTLNPRVQIRFSDLLVMLTTLSNQPINSIISVISGTALFFGGNSPVASSSLGYEHWKAQGLETVLPQNADCVLVVEPLGSSSQAYKLLRQYIEVCNPKALLIKLAPHAAALQPEDVHNLNDLLAVTPSEGSKVESRFDCLLEREARMVTMGYPSSYLQRFLGSKSEMFDCYIGCYRSPAILPSIVVETFSPAPHKQWALSSILRLLSTCIFPNAMTTPYKLQQDWSLPVPSNSRGFQRIVEIAAAKVLDNAHVVFVQREMERRFELLQKKYDNVISRLRESAFSVRGVVELSCQRFVRGQHGESLPSWSHSSDKLQSRYVVIEANHGYLTMRELKEKSSASTHLVISGLLNADALLVLKQLVEICEDFPLTPRPLLDLSSESLQSKAVLQKIQSVRQFAIRPLPTGYWFDGYFFVDFQGSKTELRPDINDILREYITLENDKIIRYNRLLALCGSN
eukprot:scaffold2338_cov184-Ochromonas_danica.AAC.7